MIRNKLFFSSAVFNIFHTHLTDLTLYSVFVYTFDRIHELFMILTSNDIIVVSSQINVRSLKGVFKLEKK